MRKFLSFLILTTMFLFLFNGQDLNADPIDRVIRKLMETRCPGLKRCRDQQFRHKLGQRLRCHECQYQTTGDKENGISSSIYQQSRDGSRRNEACCPGQIELDR